MSKDLTRLVSKAVGVLLGISVGVWVAVSDAPRYSGVAIVIVLVLVCAAIVGIVRRVRGDRP